LQYALVETFYRWGLHRGSLAWGAIADGYRPDLYDFIGAAVCLVGAGVIMYAPRGR